MKKSILKLGKALNKEDLKIINGQGNSCRRYFDCSLYSRCCWQNGTGICIPNDMWEYGCTG
ncbi:hypothetical protein [Tenacibaculum sp. 190524A02b]|uniref:WAP-type (Whey Acidic protein) with four-disulfide core n=1 Tax=Tenacibaculum vairaonense TaxID=3137860 RepID=A0ABP1F967_9FLAO